MDDLWDDDAVVNSKWKKPEPSNIHKQMKNKELKIWKVSQDGVKGWDTFSSFVCTAFTADEARRICPKSWEEYPDIVWSDKKDRWVYKETSPRRSLYNVIKDGDAHTSEWPIHIDQVNVQYLGIAQKDLKHRHILCQSFHAG